MTTAATSPLNILARIASDELALEQKQQEQAPPMEIAFPTSTSVATGGKRRSITYSSSSFRRVVSSVSVPTKGGVRDEAMRKSLTTTTSTSIETSPNEYLERLFARHGINLTRRKCHGKRQFQSMMAAKQQRPNIPSPTFEEVDAYDMETVQAVRTGDLAKLQELHRHNGHSLDASNRFGESLLHICCRRGNAKVVRFMTHEAKVNPRVVDDLGRTAFHDACWSVQPNLETMDILLDVLPPIGLLMQDARGHSPFDYARKQHWPVWVQYLQDREHVFVNWIKERKEKAVASRQQQQAPVQQQAPQQQQQMDSARGTNMPNLVPNDSGEDESVSSDSSVSSSCSIPSYLTKQTKAPRAA